MSTLIDFTGMSVEQKFEAAGKYAGVPAQVFNGMWTVESTRGKNMRSPAGAEGHFGIMPGTRKTWEDRAGQPLDPHDFDQGLMLAAMTMRENIGKFKTIPDALRAYNGGWDRARWGNEETTAYVGKVYSAGDVQDMGALTIAENRLRGTGAVESAWEGAEFDSALFEKAWAGEALGDLDSLRVAAMKRHLSDVEKGVLNQARVDTVAVNVGNTEAAALAQTARNEVLGDLQQSVDSAIANSGQDTLNITTSHITSEDTRKRAQAALEREQYAQSLTMGDKWGANFTGSLSAGIMRALDNSVEDKYPEGWSYVDHAQEYEKGMSMREREQLREAVSPADVERIKSHIDQQRYDSKVIGTLSTGAKIVWGLAAGFSDAPGWAAGFGVGKTAQIAGVGASTYIRAGRPVAAVLAGAGEGAVGNLLVAGTLDAMGEYYTYGDYISDAGFGLAFGGVLSAPGAVRDARLVGLRKEIDATAATTNADLALRAQEMAGPGASKEQILKAAQSIEEADDQSWRLAKLGNVDNKDRLFSRADVGLEPERLRDPIPEGDMTVILNDGQSLPGTVVGDTFTQANSTTTYDVSEIAQYRQSGNPAGYTVVGTTEQAPNITVFADDAARQAVIDEFRLDQVGADDATRNMLAEVIARTRSIDERMDINPEKLKTFLTKFNLEATSTTMLQSESFVSRAVASMLMENPEGAAGRRSTAAIARSAHFEEYMGSITRNTDQLYDMWGREQGLGTVGIAFNDDMRIKFNREVQLEMDRRWNGKPEGAVHPLVKRAADLYDMGYNSMARDQKFVRTLGHESLDLTTKGYFQRSWNLSALRGLSGSQRVAFLSALEDQFVTVAGFKNGPDFDVKALAATYLSRLEHRAVGMLDVPANVYDPAAGEMLRDSLKALGLSDEAIESQMRRLSRGAAGHTKTRIDMDYSKEYDDGAGNKFRLVDFLDNDMNGLYRRYAGRVSGEVALAKYGIMGDPGLQMLKTAMLRTGAQQKEIDAFDQFAAEMLGRRFGKGGDPLIVQNARMLTNLTRMGGAAFPQMGAYIDGVMGLGVVRGLRAAGSMGRMRREVQALARGEKVENSILGGFEGLGPDFGLAEYRVFGIFDTTDMVDIAGKETVGRITKAIRGGSNLQRIASGHRWITAAQTRGMADQFVRKAMRYINEAEVTNTGMITLGESKALADIGLNETMIRNLKTRMDTIAKFDDAGELMSFDPRNLSVDDIDGRRAVIEFRDAIIRGTNQIMNKEFPGEVGKWAHNGWLKMLFQFRTFSMIAQQKSFNRMLHTHGAAKLIGLMMGGMAVAAPIHMARVGLRASLMSEGDRDEFIERQLHPLALGRASMNYLASVGLWADVVESASGLGSGWADAMNIELPDGLRPTGGRMMKDASLIGGQFAPSLGVINDIGQGVMGKPDKLYRTAPFASLPYVQPLIMGIESAVDDE